MGWITNKRLQTGNGIGGYRERGKGTAPLKKIVEVIETTDNMFGQNKVKLECGHIVRSNGQYKARCTQCKLQTAR